MRNRLETVGISKKLTELGIQEKDDFDFFSKNELIDACTPGNPFMPTLEETIALCQRTLLIHKVKKK